MQDLNMCGRLVKPPFEYKELVPASRPRLAPIAVIRPRSRATPISRDQFLAACGPEEIAALSRFVVQGGPNNNWVRKLRDAALAELRQPAPALVLARDLRAA